jgi:fatty-acyl-CoA synthase
VRECAVVGRAHPRWQEVPVAFVVPEGEADEASLEAHTRGLLAAYKVPHAFHLVDALPRTALGKVRYDELRADAAALPLATRGARA